MIIINCIEGLSGSSRDEEDTLSHLVHYEMRRWVYEEETLRRVEPVVFHEVASAGDAVAQSLKFIEMNSFKGPHRVKLFLVGKSLGGVKTWLLLKSHWKALRDYARIYCLLVDPHGPIVGDGVVGSYRKGRNLGFKDAWRKAGADKLRLVDIYQQDHSPTGARWDGVENQRFPTGADHWNITDLESEHSVLTRTKILEGLEWLGHGPG